MDAPEIGRKIIKNPLSGFFYGWTIVAVALVSLGFWMGIRSSFSVFYVALLDDFSWSRGDSAGVQSLALIAYTVCAPLVGGMIDRYGPRRVITAGILVHALGLMLCATMKGLGQFYLYYGVIAGAGITAIGIVAYSAIISHWFERKRGLASGLAVSGGSLRFNPNHAGYDGDGDDNYDNDDYFLKAYSHALSSRVISFAGQPVISCPPEKLRFFSAMLPV